MHYTNQALLKMGRALSELRSRYHDLIMEVSSFVPKLSDERAREYVLHGVMRRVFLLHRCIENIFSVFPPNRTEKLSDEARIDLEINLHSFLINTYGIIENLGLAIAIENGLMRNTAEEKQKRSQVGLFTKDLKERMNCSLRDYFNSPQLVTWYHEYAKNYRDALAHRIPPYIPPAGLNKAERQQYEELDRELAELSRQGYSEEYSKTLEKQISLGIASPFYIHSFSERAKQMYLHPQVIADFRTIEEIITKVISNFYFT